MVPFILLNDNFSIVRIYIDYGLDLGDEGNKVGGSISLKPCAIGSGEKEFRYGRARSGKTDCR